MKGSKSNAAAGETQLCLAPVCADMWPSAGPATLPNSFNIFIIGAQLDSYARTRCMYVFNAALSLTLCPSKMFVFREWNA